LAGCLSMYLTIWCFIWHCSNI